ncbi:cobalamin B12-binding domain-containing protein [Pseudonocardia sp. RS11V-5]|uniref:cobalamin B12-binding domain-containing protein n=1 Tax=Pseudonocardia terrae TaxID=2905831 RepID=UPI001E48B013|nr:cobalamin B12-binding domain-containing protein [Pseudonocardia terrae]MCE3553613.1 cobalamin B12-binding domain-containing protein [Pseudonocardia terrae]
MTPSLAHLHQEGPDVVAVSCALPVHLPAAHRTIVAAQRTGTPVLAGGPGFGDGRWARRLGVDAWAPDAVEAVRLLDELPWPEPEPDQLGEGGPGPEYASLRARRGELVVAATRVLDGRTEFPAGLHDFPFAQECLRRGAAQLQDRPAAPVDGAATIREATV